MIFRIVGTSENGGFKTYYYNNENNDILDEEGTQVFPYLFSKNVIYVYPFTKTDNPYRHARDRELQISLGLKCNYKCKYCNQRPYEGRCIEASPSQVTAFMEMLKRNDIRPQKAVWFWGGEPLVYWKTLQVLIPKLREYLGNEVKLYLSTNGELLTEEIVDFLYKYRVGFSVSHDACHNDDRLQDCLQNPRVLKALKRADEYRKESSDFQVYFGVTVHENNADTVKDIEYIQKLTKTEIPVNTYNVIRCKVPEDYLRSYTKLSKEALAEITESTYHQCMDIQKGSILNVKVSQFKDKLKNHFLVNNIISECDHPTGEILTIDFAGNVLQCMDNPWVRLGKLDDLDNVEIKGYTHITKRSKCMNCPVVHLCRGSCSCIDEKSFNANCPNMYAVNFGIFKAAMEQVLNIRISNIDPVEV